MREAVYIYYGFRMRAGSLGPKNALKANICFGAFFPLKNILFLLALGAMVLWCHSGTITCEQKHCFKEITDEGKGTIAETERTDTQRIHVPNFARTQLGTAELVLLRARDRCGKEAQVHGGSGGE